MGKQVPDLLSRLASWREKRPHEEFIVDYHVEVGCRTLTPRSSVTTLQVWNQVLALAASLRNIGIGHDDVVAVQLPTWHEYFVAHLAAYAIGAITMPISPIYRTRDVERQIRLGDVSVLIVPSEYGKFDYVEMAHSLKAEIVGLKKIVVVGQCPSLKDCFAWTELIQDGASSEHAESRDRIALGHFARESDDLMLVNFSSGTTGEPKGVMHSTSSVTSAVLPAVDRLMLTSDDIVFVALTLGHAGGFLAGLYLPLLVGATVIYADLWDPEIALRIIEKQRVTYAPLMPTQLFDIANHPYFERADISSWKVARVSGGPIARKVVASLQARMPSLKLCPGWGCSEVLYATCCGPDDPTVKRNETDGRPLLGYELQIRNLELNEVLAPGEEGELVIKTPSMMLGYYKRDELTRSSFTPDGWLKSGDLGRLDADGYLTMIGRSKDLIIRGGENIPVVEIEHLLMEHPKISAAILIGIPDTRLGEKVCAVVECKESADPVTFEEMRDYLFRRELTKQFVPEYLVVSDSLPRTSVGKIKKQELRDQILPKILAT